MGTITVGQENSTPIELYYEDTEAPIPSSCWPAGRWTAGPGNRRFTPSWMRGTALSPTIAAGSAGRAGRPWATTSMPWLVIFTGC